jgi:hypothetical protein
LRWIQQLMVHPFAYTRCSFLIYDSTAVHT